MGSMPLRAYIHSQMLKLFGAITRLNADHGAREIAFRQLAFRGEDKKSWFSQVRRVAAMYGLEEYSMCSSLSNYSAYEH